MTCFPSLLQPSQYIYNSIMAHTFLLSFVLPSLSQHIRFTNCDNYCYQCYSDWGTTAKHNYFITVYVILVILIIWLGLKIHYLLIAVISEEIIKHKWI